MVFKKSGLGLVVLKKWSWSWPDQSWSWPYKNRWSWSCNLVSGLATSHRSVLSFWEKRRNDAHLFQKKIRKWRHRAKG